MIINSLLDTDLYKFTMMQLVLHRFSSAHVEYHFKCRTEGIDLRPYAEEIRQEIDHFCSLRLQVSELDFLKSLPYICDDFLEFLRLFQPQRNFVRVIADDEFGLIIKGPWLETILFEVPLLAIVNEVYFRNRYPKPNYAEGKRRLSANIQRVKESGFQSGEFKFSDFGTRRRFSREWQHDLLGELVRELPEFLRGTSNVILAKEYGIKPIGTMAHEYIQACQVLGPHLLYSQKFAFEMWEQEYRGNLAIALSDTYTLDVFLKDFDLYFCKLFDGARQDSGDPYVWGDALVEHYQKMGIDPKTKTLVFSNSLTFDKAIDLCRYFKDRINTTFGIGTHLTNDLGYQRLDIIIKMVRCNDQAVAKISDDPGKGICLDEDYLRYVKSVFGIS